MANIVGNVKDKNTRERIPGVTITFGSQTIITNDAGGFVFEDPDPISGTITFKKDNFETLEQTITAPLIGGPDLFLTPLLTPIASFPKPEFPEIIPEEPTPEEKTFLQKLIETAGKIITSFLGIKSSVIERIYFEVVGKDLTEQAFIDLRLSAVEFLTPLDELSKLFFSKNLRGEIEEFNPTSDTLNLIVDSLAFIPIAKIPGIGAKLFQKAGAKGLLGATEKVVLKKASPQVIDALVKSGNYKNLLVAMREAPAEWAKIAPKLSTQSKSLILAGLRKQADPTAFNLAVQAIHKAEGVKALGFFHRVIPIADHKFTTAALVISGMGSVLGIDVWGNWAIIDNLSFTLNREAQAARDQFINGQITREEALTELDRLISLSELGQEKVATSAKLNPIQFLFLPLWDEVAEQNTELLRTVRKNIAAVIPGEPTGTLIIRPTPTDSKVSVEGLFSTTGIFNREIVVGSYSFTVSKFGFISDTGTAIVEEGKTTDISITLNKEVEGIIPPEEVKGKLIIEVVPADAIITVAGQDEITTAGEFELTPGSYGVKAEKEGFEPRTQTAFVRTDQDAKVSFVLKEITPPEEPEPAIPPIVPTQATITITSTPTNAEVYINGEFTFTTTPYTVLLDKGNYIIRVQKDGYFPLEIEVEIEEGETDEIPFALNLIPPDAPPRDPFIPFTPVLPTGFETLFPPIQAPLLFQETAPPPEKELLINIETTDLKPWKGRIYSIALQDLSLPGTEPLILVNDNEEELISQFLDIFNQINPDKLIGFKLSFDHRYIFNKLMLYRLKSNKFAAIKLKDVKQLMDQVKEEFVYFPDKTGKLDDYGKELLGKGKFGSQKDILTQFLAKNFDYVKAFQERQLEITQGLYQLFRFSSSESFSSHIPTGSSHESGHETTIKEESVNSSGQNQCENCLAFNPLDAKDCIVCGSNKFR